MVEIKNKDLKFYLEMFLNKPISEFVEADLNKFNQLVYEVRASGNDYSVNMEDLSLFPNVKKVSISDGMISKKNIVAIMDCGIKEVRFDRCSFDNDLDLSLLSSIESLELIECLNQSYDFLKSMDNLNYLAIANPYLDIPVDVSSLSCLSNLRDVTLQKCQLSNIDMFSQCSNISFLNVLQDSLPLNISSIFNQMKKLKHLFVSVGVPLEGLNKSINVKHNLNDFLFEKEISEVDEPTLTFSM